MFSQIDKISHDNPLSVLIACPHLYLGGGVSNYYNTMKGWFSIKAEFYEVGALKESETASERFRHIWTDRVRFNNLLKDSIGAYDLVHLNPSFDYKAIIRDGLLLRIAKKFNRKAVVMFHGWNESNVQVIERHFFNQFFSTYNKSDAFIVLASDFKKKLRDWGFKQPIYLETTPVKDSLLNGFSIKERIKEIDPDKDIQILFLARIEKEKGILETIDAVKILSEKYPNLRLVVAGDGSFMDEAHNFANRFTKDKVSFLGYAEGEEKKKVFQNSDIYVFPTYHGEGMPTTVLEAMAFGLPIVTRPVGGLKDFFSNGEHGFISESKDPDVIASLVEKIITDKELWKKMSVANHEYATERFMASQVAKRLEDIYMRTVSENHGENSGGEPSCSVESGGA